MKNIKNPSKIMLTSIGIVCLLSLFLSSCLKDHNSYVAPPTAGLMVVQGSSDAPAEDFYLNNNRVTWQPFNYGNYINYISAYAGMRTAILYDYGTLTKIASDTINLNANTNYSLFLANTYSNPDFILLTDSISRPANGYSAVRFVDVSPDAQAVDLAENDTTVLVSNKSYKGYSSFMPVKGNTTYSFEVRKNGTNTVLTTLDNIAVKTGFVYTIWLHGRVSGSGNAALSAGIITNAYYY